MKVEVTITGDRLFKGTERVILLFDALVSDGYRPQEAAAVIEYGLGWLIAHNGGIVDMGQPANEVFRTIAYGYSRERMRMGS